LTRPYDWRKLLAAKVLFVLAFINLPLLLSNVFLLLKAGFHPASYIVGLLWMQSLWILNFFLPAIALASVTATLAQVFLALLFISLYMVGVLGLTELIPYSNFSTGGDMLSGAVFIGTALAVTLLQFMRRRTAVARCLIAGCGAAIALIAALTPYRSAIAREHPLSPAGQFQLALLPANASGSREFYALENKVPVRFPLSIAGLSGESFVQLNGATLALENSEGTRWESGWVFTGQMLFPGQKRTTIDLQIKKSAFDRMKSSPVKARLLVAFTLFRDANQRQFVTPAGEFSIAGLGQCSMTADYLRRIRCKVPMRPPSFLLISSENASSTCARTGRDKPETPGEVSHGSIENGDSAPAELGLSPVKSIYLYVSGSSRGICPGTPLVLSNPVLVSRNRIEMQFDNLSLDDYRRESEEIVISKRAVE
jgi:hypothetical protein